MMSPTKRLIVALSGASGQIYGIRLLEVLRAARDQIGAGSGQTPAAPPIETHLVISEAAGIAIAQETDFSPRQVEALADVVYRPRDIGAAIASGSFATLGMVVAPCSIKTLSAIANCYSSDLVSRAADVQLKEGRPLLLLVRESPLHLGHIRLMARPPRPARPSCRPRRPSTADRRASMTSSTARSGACWPAWASRTISIIAGWAHAARRKIQRLPPWWNG